jgi:lysophospholipid acyltransferase (LPLAT)-like uncharacterized protein
MNRERILALLGATILKSLFMTLRIRVVDESGFQKDPSTDPVLFCFWHNRILGITYAFKRIYPKHRRGVTVLTSASKDGEILARLVAEFQMGSVRGSSSRGGSRALLELIRLVQAGRDIAITPDGPRGPRYRLGPGVIQLAQSTGAKILPLHAQFSRCFQMKTWDGFIIPLPFSTVSINVGIPIRIPAEANHTEFECERNQLEEILKHGAN